MRVDYSVFSDKGGRELNEDCLLMEEKGDAFLAVVCDGLGGHDCGEVASKCVCDCFHEMFCNWYFDSAADQFLISAADEAQKRLRAEQEKTGKLSGIKTTLCALMFDGTAIKAIYVGDSRIYRFRGLSITRTSDHSVPEYLVRMKEIREKDIRHHPDRNKLLHVMGSAWEKAEYQFWDVPNIRNGDAFLLCTDGFWEWIEDSQMNISRIFSSDADNWLERMKNTVLENGTGNSMDNYSAIAIRFQ